MIYILAISSVVCSNFYTPLTLNSPQTTGSFELPPPQRLPHDWWPIMADVTSGQRGLEAVRNRQYAAAVPLLDKALESSSSPAWLLARAQAHQMLKNYDLALQDCELAYHVAAERGSGNSRKMMIDAQYRRSTIYFKMGRFADSDCCAKWSMLLAEGRPAREEDGVEKNVDKNGFYTVTAADALAEKDGQPGGGAANSLAAMSNLSKPAQQNTGYTSDWNRAYAWRSQALGSMELLPTDAPGRKVAVQKIPLSARNARRMRSFLWTATRAMTTTTTCRYHPCLLVLRISPNLPDLSQRTN